MQSLNPLPPLPPGRQFCFRRKALERFREVKQRLPKTPATTGTHSACTHMPDRAAKLAAHNAQLAVQRAARQVERHALLAAEVRAAIAKADRGGQTVTDLLTSLRSLTKVGSGWAVFVGNLSRGQYATSMQEAVACLAACLARTRTAFPTPPQLGQIGGGGSPAKNPRPFWPLLATPGRGQTSSGAAAMPVPSSIDTGTPAPAIRLPLDPAPTHPREHPFSQESGTRHDLQARSSTMRRSTVAEEAGVP